MGNIPEKKSSGNPCFARRHMEPAVDSFYRYALAVSKRSGVFFSDDRRDAKEFRTCRGGISPATVFRWRHVLEKDGWFEELDKGKQRRRDPKTGFFLPVRYRVLSHSQWAEKNPDRCFTLRYPPATETVAGPATDSVAGPATDSDVTCYSFMGPPAIDFVAKKGSTPKKSNTDEEKNKSTCGPQSGRACAFPLPDLVERLKSVYQQQCSNQLPTWRDADFKALERLRQLRPDLHADEFAIRFEHFLTSPNPFDKHERGSLRYFEKHFDGFLDPVSVHVNKSPAAVPGRRGKYANVKVSRFET